MPDLKTRFADLADTATQLRGLVEEIAGDVAILRAKASGADTVKSDLHAMAVVEAQLAAACCELTRTLQLLELAKREAAAEPREG